MSKQGLTVTKAEGPEWKAEANALAKAMRGEHGAADIFDLALKERDAFRAAQGGRRAPVNRALRLVEDLVAAAALAGMVVLPLLEIVVRRAARCRRSRLRSHRSASRPLGRRFSVRRLRRATASSSRSPPARSSRRGAGVARPRSCQAPSPRASPACSPGAPCSSCSPSARPGRPSAPHIPVWTAQLVLPVGFVLIALRLVWHASATWAGRLLRLARPARRARDHWLAGLARGAAGAGPGSRS